MAVSQSVSTGAPPRRIKGVVSRSPELLACHPYRSFGSSRPWLTRSLARPRTPTMRPSLTAMSRASPLECSTDADCTQRSTSSGETVGSRQVSTRVGHGSRGPYGVRVPHGSAIRSIPLTVTSARTACPSQHVRQYPADEVHAPKQREVFNRVAIGLRSDDCERHRGSATGQWSARLGSLKRPADRHSVLAANRTHSRARGTCDQSPSAAGGGVIFSPGGRMPPRGTLASMGVRPALGAMDTPGTRSPSPRLLGTG